MRLVNLKYSRRILGGFNGVFPIYYDRWDSPVFESYDIDRGWDGTANGMPAPAGVYVWHILFNNGESSR